MSLAERVKILLTIFLDAGPVVSKMKSEDDKIQIYRCKNIIRIDIKED